MDEVGPEEQQLSDEALEKVAGGVGGFTQEPSLQACTTTERKSQTIASLSNIMEKMATTADTLVQNTK
jgi:hypothetical protein